MVPQKRTGVYFDGYNFYHAVADLGINHLKWMSYGRLAQLLMGKAERVEFVKVFSAFATHKPNSYRRHRELAIALAAEGTECIMGQFKEKNLWCPGCRRSHTGHEEKETDVNIAIHLLADCFADRIDVAYIVSTDSDLTPALRMVRKLFPRIELVTVATPGRKHSFELASACQRKATANKRMVEMCLLPQVIKDTIGKVVATRPSEYDPPPPPTP